MHIAARPRTGRSAADSPDVEGLSACDSAASRCTRAVNEGKRGYWVALSVEIGLLFLTTYAGLLLFGLLGVYFAFRFIRRGFLRFKAWRDERRAPATGSSAA